MSILLISGSAKGPVLVYRWPPLRFCFPRPRLSRARLDGGPWPSRIDNPWRASHTPEALEEQAESVDQSFDADDSEYRWQRPATAVCPKSPSVSGNVSPHSPLEQPFSLPSPEPIGRHEYDHLFGYHVDFLANLLLPHQSMCHQKFELLVDDLAFIGHPVHVDAEGKWRFRTDKGECHPRAKETTTTNETQRMTLKLPRSRNVRMAGCSLFTWSLFATVQTPPLLHLAIYSSIMRSSTNKLLFRLLQSYFKSK